jgi:hypothetical protein
MLKVVILGELSETTESPEPTVQQEIKPTSSLMAGVPMIDYSKKSKDDLVQLCKERKQKGDSRFKAISALGKKELIQLLTNCM